MKPTDVDRADAARSVTAVARGDAAAFGSAFDDAVTRYGGITRLLWAVAEHSKASA